ncbi:Bardet-Biedl syndrome 7 protein-like [Oppia nitens]|uniref:Bardet-Biedl syndrome 7 protein-like n=1 Tax=Oppia nitens TaxID=1686743 RepID=UPI0023DA3A55|nr:Bardet-Biedl syndrome 7 protein-like [Oppia nitens]
MSNKLNRIDYTQVGLTSRNSFKLIKYGIVSPDSGLFAAVVGDHSGSVHCFTFRPDSANIDTIFKTLPGPNAKISCIEVINSSNPSGSPKILMAMGSSVIRGYTKKGKQFFGLELNNLTEPIKSLKMRWPNEIFITGHYIYNNYIITESDSKSGSAVQSKNYYVCPEKIIDLILIEDKHNRKTVPVLACQDRLLRVMKDSLCQYELEISGIPSALLWMNYSSNSINETLIIYGTLDGKVALVSIDFNRKPLEPLHKWEIPEKGSRSSVTCLAMAESAAELYIGRSDGNIEIWSFTETLNESGEEMIDLSLPPILRDHHNCGESLTSVLVCNNGNLILGSTFTGVIFGLTRNEMINQKLNPNYLLISKDMALKIETLRDECEKLEQKLAQERERYQEMTSKGTEDMDVMDVGVSALPYFAINDSFILQEDASYLLTLEVEIAIDAVIIQSDILLDLIDCERNSAVISFNENIGGQVLVTFRCQANTTRLEIKIRSIEGQYGLLRAYIMTRVSPKCAQIKTYKIKPLSLHKRSYTVIDTQYLNKLTISGTFSLNESHTWIELCIPEIPEKITTTNTSSLIVYNFISTFTETSLLCNCGKGEMTFQSDNVSTISIIKDFVTREATKRSTAIELSFDIKEQSVGHTLRKLYPKLKSLINIRHNRELMEAVNELNVSDPQVAQQLMNKLMANEEIDNKTAEINLERIYGIIADLFIDYHKLKGGSRSVVSGFKSRINELVTLIETYVSDDYNEHIFVDKLNQFWGIQTFV